MQILGHRGWPSPAHPENTLAAVEAALAAGADGVEVDVRLTADGVPVCCHDPDLLRIAGSPLEVAGTTSADLRRVRLPGGQTVPRLVDVAALVAGRGRLVLDLKPDRRRPALLAAAVTAATTHVPASDLVLSSFDDGLLDLLAHRHPHLARALIVECDPVLPGRLAAVVRRGDRALHLSMSSLLAHADHVRAACDTGLDIRVWTVNRLVDAALCALLGMSAVITDVPAVLVPGLVAATGPLTRRGASV